MGQLPLSMVESHKLPWCSDEYLYSLQQRFEEFSDFTRQDLFKAIYENVDRESPIYEDQFALAAEVYELLSWEVIDDNVTTEFIYEDSLKLIADDDKLLVYLFRDLPSIDAEKIRHAINSSVKSLWSCHLILWVVPSSNSQNLSGFEESLQSYKLSFVSEIWFTKVHQTLKDQRILLTLSITAHGDEWIYSLSTQLIKFPKETQKDNPILNKQLNLDEFIEIFNNSDLAI